MLKNLLCFNLVLTGFEIDPRNLSQKSLSKRTLLSRNFNFFMNPYYFNFLQSRIQWGK